MKSYALYRLGDISNDLLMLIQNASPLRWFRVIKYGHWRSWRWLYTLPPSYPAYPLTFSSSITFSFPPLVYPSLQSS